MHFPDCPNSFPSHSRGGAPRYRSRSGCFAARTGAPGLEGARVLWSLRSEGLSVYAGAPPVSVAAEAACRPVYALSDDEPPAIPTGRVFVQATEGIDLAGVVAPLGFAVESVPPYAPHAAWLTASDGSIATSLANLSALMAADGIASVEPQMLRPAADRG